MRVRFFFAAISASACSILTPLDDLTTEAKSTSVTGASASSGATVSGSGSGGTGAIPGSGAATATGGMGGLGPGTLVITELLPDVCLSKVSPPEGCAPSDGGAGCVNDPVGEWFEVHNPGSDAVDMLGIIVHHRIDDTEPDTPPFVVDRPVSVDPGGYVVFGKSTDKCKNGGVDVVFAYPSQVLFKSNAPDFLEIRAPGDQVTIDRIDWDASTEGVSRSLDPGKLSAVANDVTTNWCDATSFLYGDFGQKGTPGAPNDPCH